MKAVFRNWLAAVLVAMAGLSCEAQEVLTPQLFINPDSIASPEALAIVGDKIITADSGSIPVYAKSNPTNLLSYGSSTSTITDFGGQVGNDRVIVARVGSGTTFEIKQASDYSGSYGSVNLHFSYAASGVTRGFTNSLGELETYTIATFSGVDYYTRINFTTQAATPLTSYGNVVSGFNALEACQPVRGSTRFVSPAKINGTNQIIDYGMLSIKEFNISFPTNLSSVEITDLAFDPDSTKLYFCFTSSSVGGIGVIENFPRQPAQSITNQLSMAGGGLGDVLASGAEPGSRVYLQTAPNAAGPYTTIATNDVPLNRIGTIFYGVDVSGPRRFFRTAYAP